MIMQVLDLLDLAVRATVTDRHDGDLPRPVIHTISSSCSYYHYVCDGVDDRVSNAVVIIPQY